MEILENSDFQIFYQHGHNHIDFSHPRLTSSDFISRKKFNSLLLDSSLILCHAGAGTLLQCAYLKKVPFVIPRRACFDEHINDHQLETLQQFVQLDLAIEVKYPLVNSFFSDLSGALVQDSSAVSSSVRHEASHSSLNLLSSLQQTISSILEP